ncbi:hypothetical protein B0H34DRAFT_659245 [Crassisporium funariophilum]|nr:hypothetical protein B0H34DRAFT_659245 [Crassisporium funariophilum]
MAPRLRVLAGTSPETMVPITSLVNTNKPHRVSSDVFEGEIVTHIKGLTDEHDRVRDSEYFARGDRQGVTWSIQVQGRFLVPYSADDILFGNTFDRPLKLPWGTSAILKFMHYIDPTLDHDLTSSTKPWALSPLISTMPHLAHTRVSISSENLGLKQPNGTQKQQQPFPSTNSLTDSTSHLNLAIVDSSSSSSSEASSPASSASSLSSGISSSNSRGSVRSASGSVKSGGSARIKEAVRKVAKRRRSPTRMEREVQHLEGATQRRAYFSDAKKRQKVQFGPEDILTTDFCYGFINFAPSLSLQLPGGLSFDLMKYWDGQPVRFVCCERKEHGAGESKDGKSDGDPWGRIFWCVAIEVADDGDGEGACSEDVD